MTVVWVAASSTATAQGPDRLLEFSFTPTERAQIAIWIEREDGTFMTTVGLTSAVALRGVGNRPGALQMNSGFRWPYGRREGILPVWGHRRASAPGAELFPFVIFQDRISEGNAARNTVDASPDSYFCLSFDQTTTTREALDAVTCASVFNSDKGRFMTEADIGNGYAEPFVTSTAGEMMRPLAIGSLYPPRRDISGLGEFDHPDAARFIDEARRVMPTIDAVTMATPAGDEPHRIQYLVPKDWEDGEYTAWIEVNVEGDYNGIFNAEIYPTPLSDRWDIWAQTYGYPYRGQPSVVYSLAFTLGAVMADHATDSPIGYGSLHGDNGGVFTMDGSITDDPEGAPGSGADRLRKGNTGTRFKLRVLATKICSQPDPPAQCSQPCSDANECDVGFICGPQGRCVGACDIDGRPAAITDLAIETHPDSKWSHRVGRLSFTVPQSPLPLRQYEILTSDGVVVDEARSPAISATGQPVVGDRLHIPVDEDCSGGIWSETLCAPYVSNANGECGNGLDIDGDGDCLDAGDLIEVDVAFDRHDADYEIEMTAVDMCQGRSDAARVAVKTTAIDFATVPPCFVATAAYGSPLADEIWALRRFRDRYLMTNRAGRALVDAYYAVGPYAADIIAEQPWLRKTTRTILTPIVAFARHLTEDSADEKDTFSH